MATDNAEHQGEPFDDCNRFSMHCTPPSTYHIHLGGKLGAEKGLLAGFLAACRAAHDAAGEHRGKAVEGVDVKV